MYQFDCFGGQEKPPYCLLFRDFITSIPLFVFWILIPVYIRVIRRKEPKLRAPKWFWAHLTFQALLIVENATFGALDFNKLDHFLPFLRFARALSYTSCCIWFCLLSKRLHEIHPSFCISFLVLTVLKFVQILITIFENSLDLGDLTEFALLMAETSLLSFSTRREAEKFVIETPKSPEETASFISRIFYSWLTKLVRIGSKRPLENEDLYPLVKNGTSEYLKTRWEEEWAKEKAECEKTRQTPSIVWPFMRTQKKRILTATMARMLADIIHYLNPILLKQLIDYVSYHNQPISFGIAIACVMFLSATTRSLLQNFQIASMCRLSLYYQMVLNNAILSKILRLSPASRNGRTAGEILNHSAVDTEIISQAVVYLQNMWSVPFQVTLAMIMLSITLGWAALAGVAIMLLFIPLNLFTSKFIKRSQIAQMKVKDERTKMSNEMLNGIKVVKLYAWEESFEQKINSLRAKEVRMLRNVCILSRIVDIANATSPFLVAIASFSCYVLFASSSSTSLTPSVAFVALTIFNQLRQPMRMVAMLINSFVQAKVSNMRLKRFMNEEEMSKNVQVTLGNAVVFKNACLNWKGPNEPPTLKNITATIKSGQLVAIVGCVGGGKSSILSAILDEMCLLEGKVKIGGSLAYIPQHSWIFNKSIKNNITFGELMGSQKIYDEIVDCCQLRSDLANFQQSDETMVGENGITLSGGQKARISLARAVFQDKEIYLLDDPLSAVDTHVGRQLFDKVIGPNGILRNKTRLLVTHNLQYTRNVDMIYVIEDGEIVESGKFEDLAYLNGPFGKLWAEADCSGIDESIDEESEDPKDEGFEILETKKSDDVVEKKKKPVEKEAKNVEKVELGRVKRGVYATYFRIMGWFPSFGFLTFFVMHFVVMIGRSLWLSDWSNENARVQTSNISADDILPTETRLIVYASFGAIEIILLIFTFTLLTIGSLRASYGLHAPLIHSLLRAPITFFDLTPIGRIINRLSRDLDVIDKLQDSLRMMTQSMLNVFMILFLISYSTPIFLIVAAPLLGVYYVVMTYFIPTSRQLKRLESVNRSPILSIIGESIHGASSIRAFNKIPVTSDQLSKSIDKYAQCRYLSYLSNRWLGTRLELVGNTTVLFASLSATLSTKYFGLSPGLAGLSVSYALTITEVLNMCVRQASDLESNIVSVERIDEYQKIEPEAEWKSTSSNEKELVNWPSKGAIKFDKYSMKYRQNLPKVLNSINLEIKGGEKIGIIGRTGSGKSSLTMSIYRLIESFEGSIIIDGVDISSIGLHELRTKLIIIPQEPVVFSGTLRFNLDPFGVYSDEHIWKCLEICQLSEFARSDELKLERFISEGGKNMSQGERQLVCLCRALLRGAKIVILDEATASVDTVTDSIVQQAIRTYFPDSTTIAIAHRLDTIADSDRIVVLDNGRVAEFDTPSNLLKNPNSLYSQLLLEKNRN